MSVNPLTSMEIELNQIVGFYNDLIVLDKECSTDYSEDFEKLRDKTDMLRSEYASLYSKILTDNAELKMHVGGV